MSPRSLRLTGLVRSAPLTAAYLLVLTATTAALSSASADRDDRLLFALSTNLHQLARVPVRVLVGGALATSGSATASSPSPRLPGISSAHDCDSSTSHS